MGFTTSKGVGQNATLAEYNQGKAYKWLPSSRSAGHIWLAADDYAVNVSVWDEAWNTDFCTVNLQILTIAMCQDQRKGSIQTMQIPLMEKLKFKSARSNWYPMIDQTEQVNLKLRLTTVVHSNVRLWIRILNSWMVFLLRFGV